MRTKDSHGDKRTDLLFRGHYSIVGLENQAGCQQERGSAFCIPVLLPTLVTWRHARLDPLELYLSTRPALIHQLLIGQLVSEGLPVGRPKSPFLRGGRLERLRLQLADSYGGLDIQVNDYLANRDRFYLQHDSFSFQC